jgi:stage V sporulation protein SpoVS
VTQSDFHSREQLSESHAAELQNLGLDCGAVQHSITPLWTASQSVAEHGVVLVAFLSLRI